MGVNCKNCGAPITSTCCAYCGTRHLQTQRPITITNEEITCYDSLGLEICKLQNEIARQYDIKHIVQQVPFMEMNQSSNTILFGTKYYFDDGTTKKQFDQKALRNIDGTIQRVEKIYN